MLLEALQQMNTTGVVIINLIGFWLFGWTVEDRLGHGRFTALFVAGAAVAWGVANTPSASAGGVGAVIGAYFVLYPRSIMLVLAPVPLFLIELPAFVFLGLWLLLQVLTGTIVSSGAALVMGAALGLVLKRPERMRVEWWGR